MAFYYNNIKPKLPQNNGLAEKAVGIAKKIIKKAKSENKDLSLYSLNYRNAPVAGLTWSPAQMLQSRVLRSKTNSINKKILNPTVVDCSAENKKQKLKQTEWYDKTATYVEKEFKPNEHIMLQDKFTKLWSKAVVLNKTKWPRSYLVKDEKGKILRRNIIFMRKVSSYDLDLNESDDEVIVNDELNEKEEKLKNKRVR